MVGYKIIAIFKKNDEIDLSQGNSIFSFLLK